MKATIEIPDELYRQLKSKSALEGRAIREVATELFSGYVEGTLAPVEATRGVRGAEPRSTAEPLPAWFGLARKQQWRAGIDHEWSVVRASIDRGWADEVAEPAAPSPEKRRRR